MLGTLASAERDPEVNRQGPCLSETEKTQHQNEEITRPQIVFGLGL